MPNATLDLKLRLALRVGAVAALCFAGAVAYVLFDVHRAARERADRVAELAARDLSLQLGQQTWIQQTWVQQTWIKGRIDRFPDLQPVAAVAMAPGLCVAYRDRGETRQRLCSGTEPGDTAAPVLFATIYRGLFDAELESVRPVMFNGEARGTVAVSTDPQGLIGRSWREASRLGAIMGAALLGLCVLVYVALARALRPTRTIRSGLERLAAGDLSVRLPPVDLAELSAVRDVFNQLAGSLETTLAERSALTERLIAVQDEERMHLARELHDEFGQSLAAINAVAASAVQSAQDDCPALAKECGSIARSAGQMMEVLRGALLRLRPPDVEELGLAASLEGLATAWNSRLGGRTRFAVALAGPLEVLPADFAASLYRIAQEAITNAAKHAEATQVRLQLRLDESCDRGGCRHIEVVVDDDGRGCGDGTMKAGLGLLGMRERIGALGGRLNIETLQPSGLRLRAVIPLPSAGPAAKLVGEAA